LTQLSFVYENLAAD